MSYHTLAGNFAQFFQRLNPSSSFVEQASREYGSLKGLIEDRQGPASALKPVCFLQGSYKQDTAIYTINDVDVVALCDLVQPGSGSTGVRTWSRDEIFAAVAAPLLKDLRYRDKVRYTSGSMCVKVDLGIKVELLPVVFKQGHYPDASKEPFRLYRPRTSTWEDGFARQHQSALTAKNRRVAGNFIPAVKVFKHLRSRYKLDAVSFHVECLLYNLLDDLYAGSPGHFIASTLGYIASYSAAQWYAAEVKTPCVDRNIFTDAEWKQPGWNQFHEHLQTWASYARMANEAMDRSLAVRYWQELLGSDFFPSSIV